MEGVTFIIVLFLCVCVIRYAVFEWKKLKNRLYTPRKKRKNHNINLHRWEQSNIKN